MQKTIYARKKYAIIFAYCIYSTDTKLMQTMPPQSLKDLRELTSRVASGTSDVRLGAATLATLNNMISSPATTAISTTSVIAKANQVNPSTLTRLAYALGYSKFSQLQRVFRDHVEQNAHFYTTRVNRLISNPHSQPNSLFNAIVAQESANVASLAGDIDEDKLKQAIDLIISTRKVRFHGRRQFFSLAAFFSYGLGLIRERVDILQDDVHGISHH